MLEKECLGCKRVIIKTEKTSREYFLYHKKYCSRSCSAKNKIVSLETRLKKSLISKRLGLRPPSFHELSPKKQQEVREKLASYPRPMLGRHHSEESKLRMGARMEKHPKWKGGISLNKNYKRFKKMEYLGRKYSAGGEHSKQQWEELKAKYLYLCLCCKRQEPFVKLTEDHIIPLSLGGSDKIDNIQPLCGSCNSTKSTKMKDYRLPKLQSSSQLVVG